MIDGSYKLPEGWRWVRLGEACQINPRRPSLDVNPTTEVTFVPMSAVDAELGIIYTPEIKPFSAVKTGYTYFEENDVLFAKITPCMENGKSAVARGLLNNIGFGSTEFHVLRPIDSVLSEWIWLYVRKKDFLESARAAFRGGVGQQRVPAEFLQEACIPLPPLHEQQRIVAKVEMIMEQIREARRLRQKAVEDADRLWQAVLADTFPRPGTDLPPNWRWVRLGEVARREANLLKPSEEPNKRFRYLGMEQIKSGQWEEPQPIEVEGHEIKSQVVKFRPGIVLYGRLRPYLNKVAVPLFEGVASTEFVPIATRQDVLISHYLCAFLRSPAFVTYASNNTTGSRQPRVRYEAIWKALIPLPPFNEQQRIVAHLEAVQTKIKFLGEGQAQFETELQLLEQSILDFAFRGEL